MNVNRRGLLVSLLAAPLLTAQKARQIRVSSLDENLPIILFGQEWTTKLTFHSFNTAPTRIPVEFFATNGQPLAVPFNDSRASTMTVTLEPGQSTVFETAYEPSASATGVGRGKLDIPCSADTCGGIATTVNIRNRANGRPDFEAIFPAQGSDDRTVLPVDNSRGHSTVVMIGNDGFSTSSARNATITISFRDRSNTRVHLDQFEIPNRGARLLNLSEYSQLRDFQGVADFSAINSFGITVVGLRINPTNSFTPILPYEP